MFDKHAIATLALDAAIEADRAIRRVSADLKGLTAVADALARAWDEADPIDTIDLLHTLPGALADPILVGDLATMGDLGVALDARVDLMRRAAAGDRDALEPALRACLQLHSVLLAMGMRDFQPYRFAA